MWHRQLLKRIEGYGPHRSEVEYLDPNFTAIIDDKQSLSPLLEQMLPEIDNSGTGPFTETKALLAAAVDSFTTPGVRLSVRVNHEPHTETGQRTGASW